MKTPIGIGLSLLIVSIVLFFALNIMLGSVHIPAETVVNILFNMADEPEIMTNIILKSRIPQALTAMMAGAGLAVAC